MKIIPVIDLKNGCAVHAREGKRDQYQPLETRLCRSNDIKDIIEELLKFCQSDTVYIADLNAITRQGNHDRLISKLLTEFPDITFWIDRGYPDNKQTLKLPGNHVPVLGSESFKDSNIQELNEFNNHFILSLDFAHSETLGAKRLFSSPELWPDNIIIMTLDRVGSSKGPDLDKLTRFCHQFPAKNFIAAGGIRDVKDLCDLAKTGVQQALIASALHAGTISAEDIAKLQTKKYPG
jgi:phosphoribosylformimino-5-aminoimidazole carboxamide ribotide isomerase